MGRKRLSALYEAISAKPKRCYDVRLDAGDEMRKPSGCLLSLILLAGCSPSNDHAENSIAAAPHSAEERQAIRDNREQRRQLADEIVSGEKTFSEAGCEYNDGEWDDDRDLCKRFFFIRKADSATQEDALATRLDVMASMSSDTAAATSTGKQAADTFLTDHPEDYRGAMAAAIRAARHAGYLGQADKDKLHQLTVEIPLIGIIPGQDQPAAVIQPSQPAHLKEVP